MPLQEAERTAVRCASSRKEHANQKSGLEVKRLWRNLGLAKLKCGLRILSGRRSLFQNEEGIVTSLVTKEEFLAGQSEKFVEETFHGSLPGFLAAFTKRKKLSDKEIEELEKIISENRG